MSSVVKFFIFFCRTEKRHKWLKGRTFEMCLWTCIEMWLSRPSAPPDGPASTIKYHPFQRSTVIKSLQIEFDEPQFVKSMSKAAKSAFWKRTKRLGHGSLACLWWHKNNEAQPNIVFGAVCERKDDQLATGRPSLGIRYMPTHLVMTPCDTSERFHVPTMRS